MTEVHIPTAQVASSKLLDLVNKQLDPAMSQRLKREYDQINELAKTHMERKHQTKLFRPKTGEHHSARNCSTQLQP